MLSETRMRPLPNMAEKAYRGIPYAIAKRLGLYKRDTPEHYFAANANTNFFRNILLSEQTLDRGYFNSDKVKKLLDAKEQGQTTANTLMHLLTIVELWQRDHIDNLTSS